METSNCGKKILRSVITIFAFLSLILPALKLNTSNLLLISVSRGEYQRWTSRWETKQVKGVFWVCVSRAVGASRSAMHAMYRRITIVIAAAFWVQVAIFQVTELFFRLTYERGMPNNRPAIAVVALWDRDDVPSCKSVYIRKKAFSNRIRLYFAKIYRFILL